MGRIFLAGAVRLVIAAGGGWIAVAAFGVPLSGLFALIDVALIIAAAICVAAALSGAMWPPVIDQAGTKTRSP